MKSLYIGLMSGTSMDSIDAALISFKHKKIKLIDTASIEMPATIKASLTRLCCDDNISLTLLGETDVQLGRLFAQAVLNLLEKTKLQASDIAAIGSHGQTIYHHPHSSHPFTLQIADPNIIAAHTNITTVADFRRRDVAHHGQGAPLTPAFHADLFGRKKHDQWVLNLGGIANITWLPSDGAKPMIGFDTGPANTLLDLWNQRYQKHAFDLNGCWGRSGKLHINLLNHLLDDPYFTKKPPKSTGREYFNLQWLDEKLMSLNEVLSSADIQCTLTELTAKSVALAMCAISTDNAMLWICGGGVNNLFLMERLQTHCPHMIIRSTRDVGIAPQWIEAVAFAWLAKQTLEKKPGNCPSVTGAATEAVLGGVYSKNCI